MDNQNDRKTEQAKRDPVIIIKNEITGGKKTLTFSDNGIGFDSEKQKDKVFGLNQTFHKNKDSKGIGLYLAKTHMAEMGGQITVESRVNAGTTFKLVFRD